LKAREEKGKAKAPMLEKGRNADLRFQGNLKRDEKKQRRIWDKKKKRVKKNDRKKGQLGKSKEEMLAKAEKPGKVYCIHTTAEKIWGGGGQTQQNKKENATQRGKKLVEKKKPALQLGFPRDCGKGGKGAPKKAQTSLGGGG